VSARTNNARHQAEPPSAALALEGETEVPRQPFQQLVERNIDFVWRTLRRLGVPDAEVDDATQQVFLTASAKLAQIRPGKERSFLIAVTMRVASHARRANQRRVAVHQRLSESPVDLAPDPEHLTQRLQARALLDRVLDEMTPEVRVVFVLFELEELTVDQIAELLSLPRGTAATRLRRARVVFQEAAKKLGGRHD
jgi:RNA polymerase sigma-70 factor (ECF subfamily)